MYIKYKIQFHPLRGSHVLELCVYAAGSGTTMTLLGASEPFTTEEDDDEDFFKPVRTQSGYLRIVDDGNADFDWRDLLPDKFTDLPIVLRNADDPTEVLWTGFIQHQQADNTLYEYPIEREYAVYDVLGVMDHLYFNTGITTTSSYINFASLIKTIVDELPSEVKPANYYFQDYPNARTRLLCKVNPQLFHDVDIWQVEVLSETPCRYKCLEVMEEIGKFWGYTIRTHGADMYFTQDYSPMPTDSRSNFLKLTYAQLGTMAAGSTAGTEVAAPNAGSVWPGDAASTENYLHTTEIYDEALVKADVGPYTDVVKLFDEFKRRMLPGANFGEGKKRGDKLIYAPVFMDDCRFAGVKYTAPRVGFWQGNLFGIRNGNDPFGVGGSYNYNYMAAVGMRYDYRDENFFTLSQLWPFCFENCVLSMTASFFDANGNMLNRPEDDSEVWGSCGTYFLNMSIALIKDDGVTEYYDGDQWLLTESIFACRVGGGDNYIYPLTGDPILPGWNPADPRGRKPSKYIQMHGTGRLVIKVYRMSDPAAMTAGIGNFSVKVERMANDTQESNDSNDYYDIWPPKSVANHKVWETSTIFASDNLNQFGFGTVLNANGTPLTTFSSLQLHPEEWVARMAGKYYSVKRMVAIFELRDEVPFVGGLTPASRIAFNDLVFHPVSISHNWRDSILRMVGMQVNNADLTLYNVVLTAGTGIASVSGGGTVYKGDSTTVRCVVSDGYVFECWKESDSGVVLSTDQTWKIPSVTRNMNITAVGRFDEREYVVTIKTAIGIASVSGGGTYHYGDTAQVSCVLAANYQFNAWVLGGPSGTVLSQSQTYSFRVTGNITLYPDASRTDQDFHRIYIGCMSPSWGYVTDNNGNEFRDGDETEMLSNETRQFRAVPAAGYTFARWLLDADNYSWQNPVTIVSDDLLNYQLLTAVFMKSPEPSNTFSLDLRSDIPDVRITVKIDNGTPSVIDFIIAPDSHVMIVPAGSTVMLTASYTGPVSKQFKWWEDADNPTSHSMTTATISFYMDKNFILKAVFE